jgi:hypothetical protein
MIDDIQIEHTKFPPPSKAMSQSEKTASGYGTVKGYIKGI